MRKSLVAVLALAGVALCVLAVVAGAQGYANVSSRFVDGNLVFYDKSGNEIVTIDGTNRKMTFPSGSALDVDAAAGILLPAAGEIVNADIAAGAAIARSKLAEDALQIYGIPISALQQTTGIPLAATETAGNFDVTVGTNTVLANGEVTDNETEVSVVYCQFVLPPEYVAAGDVTVRLPAALIATGSPTNNGSTLDVAVYEQSDAGAVGSDLSTTTAAATFVALDTWYNKDFVITAAGLVAGDVLNLKITSSVIDSEAGGGTIILNLAPVKVLLDVQG